MRSTSPSPSPSPSLRERMRSREAIALQGLSRFSSDDLTEKPFGGLVICVTGLSKEARKQVQMMTERMGGQYSPDLHVNCTHLVVQSCSGRKFEHALKHGLHRGLYVVSLPWFLNSAKQYERLDESLYIVQKSHTNSSTSEKFSEAIASSSWQNSCMPVSRDVGGSLCLQPNIRSVAKSSGGSVKNMSSTPHTPHCTHASSSNPLASARFYLDPDLPSDVQAKVQEAAESWGATFVEIWSKNNNATHVVCEANSLPKYIGLNIHLVSPMWVLSARDGYPLRCVQYSADLARNVADLLLTSQNSGRHPNASSQSNGRPRNERTAKSQQEQQEKAADAKAGVRRRRGPRMQPCRTLPRPLTPISLLDSVCWVVTDAPTAAQVYTNSSGSVVLENGLEVENGHDNEHDHHGRSHGRDHEQSHRPNGISEKEIFTRPLSEREKREIVFRGAFLTILFPVDRFSEMGPTSRTFFSEEGFSREQILDFVHSFYQEFISAQELEVAIHTDSKHADRLRAIYTSKETEELGYVPAMRAEFLGSRRQFEGLKRISQEPTSQIFDLWLGS